MFSYMHKIQTNSKPRNFDGRGRHQHWAERLLGAILL
jgi:hypothetical protein